MIEIYNSVESALLIRENLDHVEIEALIEETNYLRRDVKEVEQEELIEGWQEFKKEINLEAEIVANGSKTTLNQLLNFN